MKNNAGGASTGGHDAGLDDILASMFRANPAYDLVLFDRLPVDEQAALRELQGDSDFYGILRSRERRLGVKAVCRETALLFLTLRDPGKLPAYVTTLFGERCTDAVMELVFDGILEVEAQGAFVSGPDAHQLITAAIDLPAHGATGRLSVAALQYAQALDFDDVMTLSARLYRFNSVPASPFWRRQFPTPEAVAEHLGIADDRAITTELDRHWSPIAFPPANRGWHAWAARRSQQAPPRRGEAYKLYVSPACEVVGDAFRSTVSLVWESGATGFKVGSDLYGLLRPDKIVLYFPDLEALHDTANRLGEQLAGCPAHGVPFTAGITSDGLLSWGMDPPGDRPQLSWVGSESWRLWVTNQLAVALLAAKTSSTPPVEPWRFALDRLRLAGIDPQTWVPTQAIWAERALVET